MSFGELSDGPRSLIQQLIHRLLCRLAMPCTPGDLGGAGGHMPYPEGGYRWTHELWIGASVRPQADLVADAPMHSSPHCHQHGTRRRVDHDHANAAAFELAGDDANRAFGDNRLSGKPDVAEGGHERHLVRWPGDLVGSDDYVIRVNA